DARSTSVLARRSQPPSRLAICLPADSIAGRMTAITAAAAIAIPSVTISQFTTSPRSSTPTARRRLFTVLHNVASIWVPPFSGLHGLGEEVQEAVGHDQHQRREQRRERTVHRQVGTVSRLFEQPVLFRARLRRVCAQEVEIGALLRCQQLGEAGEVRFARLACDLYE